MYPKTICAFGFLSLLLLACRDSARTNTQVPEIDQDRQVTTAPAADKRLTLTSTRKHYLLGEPVVLDLRFQNDSKDPMTVLQVFVEPFYYEAPLWIAEDKGEFNKHVPQTSEPKRERRTQTIEPGASLDYQFRVVARWKPEFQLVFARVGEYRVYAVYPLYIAGSEKTIHINSSVVQVRIMVPAGEDAVVWKKLNDPLLLGLLQAENASQQYNEVPIDMARILRAHPKSGYAPAMRRALSKVYFHRRNEIGLPRERIVELATALGVTEVALFNDKRLAVQRKEFPKETSSNLTSKRPVDSILGVLSSASGVSLEAPQELKAAKAECGWLDVGQCMQSVADQLEASWERRGQGYVLVPFNAHNAFEPKKAEPEKK